MPCDTIQTNTVDLAAADHELLAKAIEGLGFTVSRRGGTLEFYDQERRQTVTIQGGRITVRQGGEAIIDQVKQAYSRQVLTVAAARFGWSVQQKAPQRFTVSRRF